MLEDGAIVDHLKEEVEFEGSEKGVHFHDKLLVATSEALVDHVPDRLIDFIKSDFSYLESNKVADQD